MKKTLFLLIAWLQLSSCSHRGSCEHAEDISFRNVRFKFPLSARDVLTNYKKHIYTRAPWIVTHYIAKNTSAIWFFDWPDWAREPRGSLEYLKDARMYGVTFLLLDKEFASDEEIVKGLQKIYPGNYECVEWYGMHYYILDKGCIKIIYNWASTYGKDSKWCPAISFVYGLNDREASAYGHNIGNTMDGD